MKQRKNPILFYRLKVRSCKFYISTTCDDKICSWLKSEDYRGNLEFKCKYVS